MVAADAAGKGDGRLVFDTLSAMLLLMVAVLGAYMPKYLASKGSLQQGTASSLAFHLGNMLSGGVMLSAGFCHLLADALRQLAFVGRFPMAPFLSAVGYLITLLADQVVQLLTTDAEGRGSGDAGDHHHQGFSRMHSPADSGFYPGGGGGRGLAAGGSSRCNSPSPIPPFAGGGGAAAAAAGESAGAVVGAAAKKFGGFFRSGGGGGGGGSVGGFRSSGGSKGWAYSKLEDLQQPQQQLDQGGTNSCQPTTTGAAGGAASADIELIPNGAGRHNSSSIIVNAAGAPVSSAAAHEASAPEAAAFEAAAAHPQQQQQQQQHLSGCCHNPATCPCCHARSTAAAAAAQNPGPQVPRGLSRRPGSAGGLVQTGLGGGVVSVARTRSLTNPGALGPPQMPPIPSGSAVLPAAAAGAAGEAEQSEAGSAFADADAVTFDGAAAAAAAAAAGQLPVSTTTSAGAAVSGFALHAQSTTPPAAAAGADSQHPNHLDLSSSITSCGFGDACDSSNDATCLLAAGSPRSVSAGGLRPRSPRFKSAGGGGGAAAAVGGSSGGGIAQFMSHQQQQQQHSDAAPPSLLQRGTSNASSIAHLLLQPVRQPSLPPLLPPGGGAAAGCCCCCGGGGGYGGGYGSCRSQLPHSAQPDMTEACTVARVAGHLELEVMSTTTGGHNHGHFQVFLSQRPLSFATSLLLACALCIHSILEGLALGAQQSMQATEDIMLAIAAHKGLAAYALGASIVESRASDSKFWVVVCLFAAATPLGISLGYASSVLGHGPVSAAMSALASGTFLYVALNEVIPKELEHPDGHRLAKVAALLLGFGLMSLLAVWA